MKKIFLSILLVGLIAIFIVLAGLIILKKTELISPLPKFFSQKTDLTPYSFENLKKRQYYHSKIKLGEVLREEENFTTYLFSYLAEGKRITGMANLPKKEEKFPVAILLRGWVDEKDYYTGKGSDRMADFLAENGFITLAPDFLGYGGSASAFPDMLQTRFFRPITVISLIESLKSLSQADVDKIVMWGHSNGGQVALSVLEITGKNIPTSLWAPVSAPFPESVLHYAEELEDQGKLVKEIIVEFEKEYDPSLYSVTNYLDQINSPLIIHQGTDDEAVPLEWTENLVEQLQAFGKEITYYKYLRENHNFNRGSAPVLRNRDLKFFKESLKI